MDIEKIQKRIEEMKERGAITDKQIERIYNGISARNGLKYYKEKMM